VSRSAAVCSRPTAPPVGPDPHMAGFSPTCKCRLWDSIPRYFLQRRVIQRLASLPLVPSRAEARAWANAPI
jgi:hypothetical protein